MTSISPIIAATDARPWAALAALGHDLVTRRLEADDGRPLPERLAAAERAFFDQAGVSPPQPRARGRPGWPGFRRFGLGRPAVSVILPTFNRAAYVGDAIASVVAQSEPNWELVVVDDGGEDRTKDAVRPFLTDRRIRLLRQDHAGQSAARNRGLGAARGPLVAFLDSDNLYFPGFLAVARAALAAEPKLMLAYGALATRHHLTDGAEILLRPFDRDSLENENFVDLNTVVCRRAAIARIGGFDEQLEALEDWDLVLRLTGRSPARPLPVLAAYYREVDDRRISARVPMDAPRRRVTENLVKSRRRSPRPTP